MRRVPDNLAITLPPVHLHLDDVEHILNRLSDGMDAVIKHGGFAYDSLEELKDHTKRDTISELQMSARRHEPTFGFLSVDVTANGVRVWADHIVAERATLITEFLRSRIPWYSWRPGGNWWYGVRGALGGLLAITAPLAIIEFVPLPTVPQLILAAIALLLGNLLAFTDRVWIGGSRIHLYPSVSHIGFWERNREKILVAVISSVASGLVGFLLGRLTH
jgi:hypothetical protein